MRHNKAGGFTLIELLIVIAIIGILAAVLIPNLLNARKRAFDTAAQTCLKEIATTMEIEASKDPWKYVTDLRGAAADPHSNGITSCDNVTVAGTGPAADGFSFNFTALHQNGSTTYQIANGTGVTVAPAAP